MKTKPINSFIIILYLHTTCVCIYGRDFYTEFQTTRWQYEQINKDINVSSLLATFHTKTILGCSTSCSILPTWALRSFYFNPKTNMCNCSSKVDDGTRDIDQELVWYGEIHLLYQREVIEVPDNNEYYLDARTTVWPYHADCLGLYDAGYTSRGVYSISTWDNKWTYALCENGYTVIQRRFDGSLDFNRNWENYVTGFGNRTGEYWIGLNNIHYLTTPDSELIVYIEAFPGTSPSSMSAHYTHFQVGDEESKYIRSVGGFSGNCGDSLENGLRFSTYDNDNDRRSDNCAIVFKGGWWFRACHNDYLNGQYYNQGEYANQQNGIHWNRCWLRRKSAKATVMKVRRKR